jgi:selenium metabolism protein YedF
MADKTLDCRGLACPDPVIATKESLKELGEGTLAVILDNEVAKSNVCRFLDRQGFSANVEQLEESFTVTTGKGGASQASSKAPLPKTAPVSSVKEKAVVYISSETMGHGDDELVRGLMATYIDTLSHVAHALDTVPFVNSGVNCAAEGSPVLESIKNLESAGVKILSCGNCLNHFGLKEQLRVGEVTNMYSIIETTLAAGRILKP